MLFVSKFIRCASTYEYVFLYILANKSPNLRQKHVPKVGVGVLYVGKYYEQQFKTYSNKSVDAYVHGDFFVLYLEV